MNKSVSGLDLEFILQWSGFTTSVESVAVSVVDLAIEVIPGEKVMRLRGQDAENVIFWLLKSSEMMTEVVLDKMIMNPEVGT